MKLFDRKTLALLASFSGVIGLQRAHTYQEPLECDTALFSVLAHEWNLGRRLYSDLWDTKPPGMIVTFAAAQKITGDPLRALFFLELLASVLTLLGIFAAVAWMTGDRPAALWAAAFWTAANAAPLLEANQPVTEVFINLCWGCAMAGMFRFWRQKSERKNLWIAGIFLALATFYKHHLLLANMVLVLSFMSARINRRRPFWDAVQQEGSPLVLPTAFLWLMIVGYFSFTHRSAILWDTLVTYSRHYASDSLLTNLMNSLRPSEWISLYHRGIFGVLAPPAIAGAIGAGLAASVKDRRWIFLAGYVAAAWVGIALPGRFYSHYFLLLMPSLIVAACAAIPLLRRHAGPDRLWISRAVPALCMGALLLIEFPFYNLSAEEWSRAKYGDVYVTVKKMGEEIGQNLLPGETFYDVGYEPGLYFYGRKSPPTGILMADHWETGPLQNSFTDRIINDLEQHQPELLVTTDLWLAVPGHAQLPLMQWCLSHYRLLPQDSRRGPFLLYALKGGALEARVKLKPAPAPR